MTRPTFKEQFDKLKTPVKWVVKMGQGEDTTYGNVDDLILAGFNLTYQVLVTVSKGRGTDTTYGNVDKYIGECFQFTNAKFTLLSLGFGTDETSGDVSMLDPVADCLKKYRETACTVISDDNDPTNMLKFFNESTKNNK